MKKIILAVIVAGVLHGQGNWNWPSTGPDGGTILSVASDGNNTVATSINNAWRRNGDSWDLVLYNVGAPYVLNTGQSRFCLIKNTWDSTRVYFSSNGGLTWNSTLLINGRVTGFSRVHGSYVYIATEDGIYQSSDGGNTWSIHNAPYQIYPDLVVITYLPDDPSTVYLGFTGDSAGVRVFRLYRSTDFGTSWNLLSTSDYLIGMNVLAINPANPQELVAGVSEVERFPGLYVSTNGGANWSYIMSSLSEGLIVPEALAFKNDTLYIGTAISPGITIGRSVSGVWFFTHLDTIHIVHDISVAQGTIYCAYSGGVSMSTDGINFTDITSGLKAVYTPWENGFVGNRISRSTGGTMYLIDDLYSVEPSNQDHPIFSNVIYRTTDYGMTWDKLFIPRILMPFGIQSPQNDPSIVYLTGFGYELSAQSGFLVHTIYRSNDSAGTFVPMDQGFPPDSIMGVLDMFWVSPSDPNRIIAKFFEFDKGWKVVKQGEHLLYSDDGGQSFTVLLPEYTPLRGASEGDTLVLSVIGTSPGVLISLDGGLNWLPLPEVRIPPTDVEIMDGNIYAATVGRGGEFILMRTVPGQTDWDTVPGMPTVSGLLDAHLSSNSGFLAFEAITRTGSMIGVEGPGVFSVDYPNFPVTEIQLMGLDPSGSGYMALLAFTPGFSAYYTEDPFVGISESRIFPDLADLVYTEKGPVLNIGLNQNYRLEIFDPSGRKVFDNVMWKKKVELARLSGKGVYFFRLKSGGYQKTGKFVVFK